MAHHRPRRHHLDPPGARPVTSLERLICVLLVWDAVLLGLGLYFLHLHEIIL